jgi:hypothetical protein
MEQPLQTNEEMTTQAASETGAPPYDHELRPHDQAGENYGTAGPHAEKTAKTAYDVKGVHDAFNNWRDDDLKQIAIIPEGSRLEQGATYVDLKLFEPHEFSARANMVATADNWYVLKSSVPYPLWNRLIGVDNPERLDGADDGQG